MLSKVVKNGYRADVDISATPVQQHLATLSYRYAAALDRRDLQALLGVFHPLAVLRAQPPGRNPMLMTGHTELAKLIKAVEYWPRTFHLVGQSLFEVTDDRATGEVYCVANHFSTPDPVSGTNDVMYIRYEDTYRRDVNGRWLIMERVVTTDAVERRDVGTAHHTNP